MSIEERKDQIGAAPDTSEPRRFCRKCLTREMEQTEYFRTLHEYIANLDADLKVDDEVYVDAGAGGECGILIAISSLSDN